MTSCHLAPPKPSRCFPPEGGKGKRDVTKEEEREGGRGGRAFEDWVGGWERQRDRCLSLT